MNDLKVFKRSIHRSNLRIVLSAVNLGLASGSLRILGIFTLAIVALTIIPCVL